MASQTSSLPRFGGAISWVVLAYIAFASVFGSLSLDKGEFSFVRDPYEMLGGDYAAGYIRAGEYGKALDVALRSYRFYWTYRPMWSPVIAEKDRALFAEEEERFGYVKPGRPGIPDQETYEQRLIVPEPDRFYRHGAGKPLLSAVAHIPGLALTALATRGGHDLLYYQFHYHMHPVFILVRLAPILAGLMMILVVHRAALRITTPPLAVLAAGVAGLYPTSVVYFPNLLHDTIMVPFAVLAAVLFARRRYTRAGIAFGFALAAKNSAIFVLPALMVYAALQWRRRHDPEGGFPGWRGTIRFALPALLILSIFANPISYVSEILTPLTHRAFDPRGEAVNSVFLSAAPEEAASNAGRGLVNLIKTLFPMNLFMIVVVPAIPLLWRRMRTSLGRIALLVMLAMFPYALVFTYFTEYRVLLFVPFMALVTAEFFTRRAYLVLLAVLVVVDLLLATNPMAATWQHF